MKKKMVTIVCMAALSTFAMGTLAMAEETTEATTESATEEGSEAESDATTQDEDSVTLTDVMGREVTVQLPVEEAYLGYYYENFLAVVGPEAFTRVKATSLYDTEGYDNTIPELYSQYVDGYSDMTDVGSTLQDNFDIEKLIELDCDVAIMGQYQYNALEDKISLLEDAGIPVVVIDYTTATEERHIESTEILGKIFQVEDRAEEICDTYKEHMDAITELTSKVTDRVKTFHEYDSMISSYSEIGVSEFKDSLFGHYLDVAGAQDIVDLLSDDKKDGSMTTLDLEYILEQDPEVWFVIGGGSSDENKDGVVLGYGITEEQILDSAKGMIDARPGFSELSAVKNNKIYFISNNLLRTLRDYTVVEYLAKAMYPDEFADLDPEKDLEEYAEKYLPSLPTDGIFFYHYDQEA